MLGNGIEQRLGIVIEKKCFPALVRICITRLSEHLNHHIICRLVYKRNENILPVHLEGSVLVLCHGSLGNLPYKIPCQLIGNGITELFNICFVYIASLGGTHERYGIIVAVKIALIEMLFYYLIA